MTYAGDVSVLDCWKTLETEPGASLVDVRTVPEWQFVGIPDLSGLGKSAMFVEWQRYPDMSVNTDFASIVSAKLSETGAGQADKVFMLCRSGVRSIAAAKALTAHGYTQVFNVLGGFEGDKDQAGHRATLAGWKFDDCPWSQ